MLPFLCMDKILFMVDKPNQIGLFRSIYEKQPGGTFSLPASLPVKTYQSNPNLFALVKNDIRIARNTTGFCHSFKASPRQHTLCYKHRIQKKSIKSSSIFTTNLLFYPIENISHLYVYNEQKKTSRERSAAR